MNFLIFRDFFGFFLNFSEFKINLFDFKFNKITFYFCTGDVAACGASDSMTKITIVD